LSDCAAPFDVDPTHLRLLVDDDGDFTNATVYATGGGLTISYSGEIITVTGISNAHIPDNFTRYLTIASIDLGTPLPIELLEFNATPNNEENNVLLDWITASEINNDYFDLERSRDGIGWNLLTTIDGSGTSSSVINYSFYDENPHLGTSYYRLKQVDFDGSYSYSNIRSVNLEGINIVSVYPNPSSTNMTILVNSKINNNAKIVICDMLSRTVYSFDLEVCAGLHECLLDLSKLSSGSYLLNLDLDKNEFLDQIQIHIK